MVIVKSGNSFYGQGNYQPKTITAIVGEEDTFIPTSGGRSSVPDVLGTAAPPMKLIEIPPDFSLEYLATLENLCAFNSDLSYALDNIVQLANTPHDICFSDKISEKQANVMKEYLKQRESRWYQFSGGGSSLKGDLLAQVVVNGALSAEIIPDDKLEGIKQIVRIRPKNIRFYYDSEKDIFAPYQIGNYLYKKGTKVGGMVELNTNTYHYIALRRLFQTPYAVPPFISAIEALCIQRDMLNNFKEIMKKLGMLGFLSAEVDPPTQLPGETPTQYWERCISYLDNTVYPQLNKNLAKGVVAGFKDRHKFTLQGNNMNVTGAQGLFDIVQERIFAAIKQDPNMNGKNLATTETFGRVILAKMLSQTAEYQKVVDTFYEHAYMMELKLGGFSPGYVEVKSQKPLVNDQVKEETAEGLKIDNVIKKRNAGIIGQDKAANELGYDEADSEGDIIDVNAQPTTIPGGGSDPTGKPGAAASNVAIRAAEIRLFKQVPVYDYGLEINCGHRITRYNFSSFTGTTKLEAYQRKYFTPVYKQYRSYSKDVAKAVGDKLLTFQKSIPLDNVQREVYLSMLTRWEQRFAEPVTDIVKSQVPTIYDYYRKDKSVFKKRGTSSNASSFANDDIPAAVLELDDYRAIEYMERSDAMYLGKFITDPDTKKKVYAYLQTQYLEGTLPIGNDSKALQKFVDTFEDVINLEAWKIRRIIDTSVNKVRNYAHVGYLTQASVETFEVLEVMDDLTCQYCSEMDGKKFSVTTAKNKISKEIGSNPGDVSYLSPFLTSEPLEKIQSSSADELQSMGFDTPPYHPHCRGTVVADI